MGLTDPTITTGLAGLAVATTIGLQTVRATHYDGKLEALRKKLSDWLQQTENELKAEMRNLMAHPGTDPSIVMHSRKMRLPG